MTVVVSFQRAINVGRGRSVPMAELKAVYESVGCRDVRTFLQSCNVVYATDGKPTALTRKLEAALARRFGFAIPVINRTAAELRAAVAGNPFPKEARDDPGHLVVVFLAEPPGRSEVEALAQPIAGPERLKLIGADLYIYYAAGIGRSKLKLPLTKPGTARNWTTITKLAAIADAMNSQPAAVAIKSTRQESAPRGRDKGANAMAKGQMRPSKEKRKPKADKNKPKKGGPAPSMGAQPSSSTMPPMPPAWSSKKT
jgi:uncharacterized protein (DUF1697 family)